MSSSVEDESKPITGNPPTVYPQPHPGHPPPYQGYPTPYPSYPNLPPTYPYPPPVAPPPATYYAASQHYLPAPPEKGHGYNFARLMLFVMIILIVGTSALSFITWLIFGSNIPIFHVELLEMPIFNISSNSDLMANWVTNISVENPNRKLEVSFDHIETTLIYKDYWVDSFFAEPFQLSRNERKTIRAEFETPNSDQNITGDFLVKDIGNERRKGNVAFDLRIILSATFRSDSVWRKRKRLRILCEDLEVVFPLDAGATTAGKWGGGNLRDCLVLI